MLKFRKMKTIVFKIMGTDTSNTIEIENLPNSYQELLEVLKKINSSINYKNNITFCIDGKPFNQTCKNIIYPAISQNKFFIVVLIKPNCDKQTHNDWGKNVRKTVEGYVLPGINNKFVPKDRLGNDSGVSLTFGEGTSIRDKNGNPIKISVQTINGPSKINRYQNISKD